MCDWLASGEGQPEIRVIIESAVIPPGNFVTCFEIEAVDDDITEDNDTAIATVQPLNPNDLVLNGNTSITIIDNDGMFDLHMC